MISVKLRSIDLAALERARFVELFGGVFEHAPWVAEQAFPAGPFTARWSIRCAGRRASDSSL
jgi:2-oxo-4-hydroxy-4-carboxy-5-ureidoimidazoline decarboxylase